LYRYSNQGWGYQNKRLGNRYHHHTQSSGSSGTNIKLSSKINPIGQWYMYVLHWMGVDKTSEYKHTIVGRMLEVAIEAVPEDEEDNDYVGADEMDVDEEDGYDDDDYSNVSYGNIDYVLCCGGQSSGGDNDDDDCTSL
jgi:hypothetical protein